MADEHLAASIPQSPHRPRFPAGYGTPTDAAGLLAWHDIDLRLTAATTYWLATSSATGTPHAVPIAGVWHAGRLYFGGDPATRWARHLQANPRAVVHLESGSEVVILHGVVEYLPAPDESLRAAVQAACIQQYGEGTTPPWWVLIPRAAYAWTNLAVDPTRWHFT